MAALIQIASFGRGPAVFANLAGILVTVNTNGATYTTGTGGLPIDLTVILQTAAPSGFDAPNYIQALNPLDIVGVMWIGYSTNGYLPGQIGNLAPTYTQVPWQSVNGVAATPGILATCPATIRLTGPTGAEVANGVVNDTFTMLLLMNRTGPNY